MKRKILIFSIALIIISVALTSLISINVTIRESERDNIVKLENYANLISMAVEEDLINGVAPDFSRYASDFGDKIGDRVTFVAPDGKVLGDSSLGAKYTDMENHRYREEIKEALSGVTGVGIRDSGTLNVKFVYVAVPLIRNGNVEVITRVAMEIDQLEVINNYIIKTALASAIAGILAAVALSLIYSGRLTRPVGAIMKAVSGIAEGNYDDRVYIKTGDEMEAIAERINETADRLSLTISELSENNSKMMSVLSSMKEALIAVDNDFNVILTNRAAAEMFGLTEKDAGVHLLRVFRRSQLYEAFKRVVDDRFLGDQEIDLGDDKIYKIRTALISSQKTGKSLGIMALIEDITDYRKLENIRKDFVANVSHELKTPLTSIAGFVETLQGRASEDPVVRKRFLDIIAVETARLKRLIDDILIISDIERGRETRSDARIDIREAIDATIRSIDPVISEKHARIIRDYQEGEFVVLGNPDRFRQMMVNLIENAVKYSGPEAEVRIAVARKDDRIQISVRDNGCGISEEHLPRIFERFYRVDRSRSQKEGGTGLGLAIVKHIVNLFDGEINVQSKVGEGTEFTIIL